METLDSVEARVVGVLVEKQMTTPDSYPLTLAGVVAGCNQSTNRDPVMDLDEDEVERALVRLHDRGLATPVRRPSDRAIKYRHKLAEAMDLDGRATAVLAVLLLRGAQTSGELRQRTDRYVDLASIEETEEVIDGLEERGLVRRLSRRPGQSQRRVAELLSGEGEPETRPMGGVMGGAMDGASIDGPAFDGPASPGSPSGDVASRLSRLEERFEELLRRLGEDDL